MLATRMQCIAIGIALRLEEGPEFPNLVSVSPGGGHECLQAVWRLVAAAVEHGARFLVGDGRDRDHFAVVGPRHALEG